MTREGLSGPRAGGAAQQLGEPAAKPLVVGAAGRRELRHRLRAAQLIELAEEGLGAFAGDPDRVVVGYVHGVVLS